MRDPLLGWGTRIPLQTRLCFRGCQLENPGKVDQLTESLLNVCRRQGGRKDSRGTQLLTYCSLPQARTALPYKRQDSRSRLARRTSRCVLAHNSGRRSISKLSNQTTTIITPGVMHITNTLGIVSEDMTCGF